MITPEQREQKCQWCNGTGKEPTVEELYDTMTANTEPEDEKATCSICKHRNEGDGIHGMYCELHNVACEYEAKCSNWLQSEDK